MSENYKMMPARRIAVDVLGYREGEDCVALALEMDLRGYGSSFGEALRDLEWQVAWQLSFALYKHGAVDMALRPAEVVYLERFAAAKREGISMDDHEIGDEFLAMSIPYPSPDALERVKREFESRHV